MATYNSLAHKTFGPVETPDRYYFAHVGPPAVLYGPHGLAVGTFFAERSVVSDAIIYVVIYRTESGRRERTSTSIQELVDFICQLDRLNLLVR
jgi:hypothetical protein